MTTSFSLIERPPVRFEPFVRLGQVANVKARSIQ
jgi:hypothetical protein